MTVNESNQCVEIQSNQEIVQDLAGWSLSPGGRLTCHLDDEIQVQPSETLRI